MGGRLQAAKAELLSKVRIAISPWLVKHHISWVDLESSVALISQGELNQAIENPELFLEQLLSAAGNETPTLRARLRR